MKSRILIVTISLILLSFVLVFTPACKKASWQDRVNSSCSTIEKDGKELATNMSDFEMKISALKEEIDKVEVDEKGEITSGDFEKVKSSLEDAKKYYDKVDKKKNKKQEDDFPFQNEVNSFEEQAKNCFEITLDDISGKINNKAKELKNKCGEVKNSLDLENFSPSSREFKSCADEINKISASISSKDESEDTLCKKLRGNTDTFISEAKELESAVKSKTLNAENLEKISSSLVEDSTLCIAYKNLGNLTDEIGGSSAKELKRVADEGFVELLKKTEEKVKKTSENINKEVEKTQENVAEIEANIKNELEEHGIKIITADMKIGKEDKIKRDTLISSKMGENEGLKAKVDDLKETLSEENSKKWSNVGKAAKGLALWLVIGFVAGFAVLIPWYKKWTDEEEYLLTSATKTGRISPMRIMMFVLIASIVILIVYVVVRGYFMAALFG